MTLQKTIASLVQMVIILWMLIGGEWCCYARGEIDIYNPGRLISVSVYDGLEVSTVLSDSTSSVFTNRQSSAAKDLDITMQIELLDKDLQKISVLISNEHQKKTFRLFSFKARNIFENNLYEVIEDGATSCASKIGPETRCVYNFKGKTNFHNIDSTSCFEIKLIDDNGKYRTTRVRPWDALLSDLYAFDFTQKQFVTLKNILPDDVVLSQVFFARHCELSEDLQIDQEMQALDLGEGSRKIEPNDFFTINLPQLSPNAPCVLLVIKYIANREIKMMPLLLHNTISNVDLSHDVSAEDIEVDPEGGRNENGDDESVQTDDRNFIYKIPSYIHSRIIKRTINL